jgi:hypothetical protein
MSERQDDVTTHSIGFDAMISRFRIIDDLLASTPGIRNTTRIPSEADRDPVRVNGGYVDPKKVRSRGSATVQSTDSSHSHRIARAVNGELYADTISKLAPKPFRRPVVFVDVPEAVSYLHKDTDGKGKSFTLLLSELFWSALNYGKCHAMADWSTSGAVDSEASVSRDLASRVKVYEIDPRSLYGWTFVQVDEAGEVVVRGLNVASIPEGAVLFPDSENRLAEIRVAESRTEPVGEFGEESIAWYRRYLWDRIEEWREGDDGAGKTDVVIARVIPWSKPFDGIPLATGYLNQIGPMLSLPTMESLAYVDEAHIRSRAEQTNYLRTSRFATLAGFGWDEKEWRQLAAGPGKKVRSSDVQAKLEYVETSGTPLEQGWRDLEHWENIAERMAAQPLARENARKTATGVEADESGKLSPLEQMAREMERVGTEIVRYACQWHGVQVPDGMRVEIPDFSLDVNSSRNLDFLRVSAEKKLLSNETFLEEARRYGVFRDDFDAGEELERIEAELGLPPEADPIGGD